MTIQNVKLKTLLMDLKKRKEYHAQVLEEMEGFSKKGILKSYGDMPSWKNYELWNGAFESHFSAMSLDDFEII